MTHWVREWLTTAATVESFVGFAKPHRFLGPTREDTGASAEKEIARRYQEFVDIFGTPRTSGLAEVS